MSRLADSPLVKGDRREFRRRVENLEKLPPIDPKHLRRIAAQLLKLADAIERSQP